MNENNSKKNRPKSQIMMPNTTSPLPSQQGRKNGSSDSLPNHRYENEWEVRGKELAEAKSRVAQMEKTMRWWCECTENWRKKWSEVKTERNELRKELRVTKNQLDKAVKQLNSHQHQDLSFRMEGNDSSHDSKNNGIAIYSNSHVALALSTPCSSRSPYQQKSSHLLYENTQRITSHYTPMLISKKNAQTQTMALSSSQISVIDKEIVSLLEEKVAHLTSKLDEVSRRFIVEKDEKTRLEFTIERLRRDYSDLHELYDSLKKELCDINGKEFTESEVESYAEEEGEEGRLIDELGHDGVDADELEEDEFDIENDAEAEKHTPTAESLDTQDKEAFLGENAQTTSPTKEISGPKAVQSEKAESNKNHEVSESHFQTQPASPMKQDLASSIQVEISQVHKKLDLKTFINDVTELVGGIPIQPDASQKGKAQNKEHAGEEVEVVTEKQDSGFQNSDSKEDVSSSSLSDSQTHHELNGNTGEIGYTQIQTSSDSLIPSPEQNSPNESILKEAQKEIITDTS